MRPTIGILIKLLITYLLPTLILFSLFGFLVYEMTRRELDAELGRRVAAISAATAAQVRGKYLLDLVRGDEEEDRAYLNTQRKLEAVLTQTGVRRMYIFRPDLTSLCDTQPHVLVGEPYYRLEIDRHEITRMFQEKSAVASVLFLGVDGVHYKAGYAPVMASEDDPTVVAGLAVEAPAAYFTRLLVLRRRIVEYGLLVFAVVVVASFVLTAFITRPLRQLAQAARTLGEGKLDAPIPNVGRDEIGVLAHTLEDTRHMLRARDERMQQMLAGIAHEVRNPLGGIELFLGLLREEVTKDESHLHIERIQRELTYLKVVVNDFLEYARRPKPELVPVALVAILSDVCELCQPEAQAANVRLKYRQDADPGIVSVDAGQMRRAVLNLVRNAIQATPPGKTVTVSVGCTENGRALIRVQDSGKGIASDEQCKIFAPFYTTKEKGTGLGLALTEEIVRAHSGRIRVESTIGHGAVFEIEL